MELILRAYDTLEEGILVVSPGGEIRYYNQVYARLRHLSPGALLGHPLEEIDRRHRLRQLLRTGTLPPDVSPARERNFSRCRASKFKRGGFMREPACSMVSL
jgi:PAS domain-containing protein